MDIVGDLYSAPTLTDESRMVGFPGVAWLVTGRGDYSGVPASVSI